MTQCSELFATNPTLAIILILGGFLLRHFGPQFPLLSDILSRLLRVPSPTPLPGPGPAPSPSPSGHPLLDLLRDILRNMPAGPAKQQAVEALVGQLASSADSKESAKG